MIVRTIHSLEKVFFDRAPEPAGWCADVAARGEVYSFQVMLVAETMSERGICRIAVQSELPVEVRQVQNVPVRQAVNFNPDDDYLRKEPGLYPDLLDQLDNGRCQLYVGRQALWVTVRVPEDVAVIVDDNRDFFAALQPPLACIDHDEEAIGTQAVRVMLKMLRKESVEHRTQIPCHLILRESAG